MINMKYILLLIIFDDAYNYILIWYIYIEIRTHLLIQKIQKIISFLIIHHLVPFFRVVPFLVSSYDLLFLGSIFP